jgi:hypothetical protein
VKDFGTGFQVPGATLSTLPWTAAPVMVGWVVEESSGGAPPIGPISFEAAMVDPRESVARTVRPSVWPTSSAPRRRRRFVAPRSDVQRAPIWSQRNHWYRNASFPEPDHVPLAPYSGSPWVASPATIGRVCATGPVAASACGAAVPATSTTSSVTTSRRNRRAGNARRSL